MVPAEQGDVVQDHPFDLDEGVVVALPWLKVPKLLGTTCGSPLLVRSQGPPLLLPLPPLEVVKVRQEGERCVTGESAVRPKPDQKRPLKVVLD